MPKAEGHEGGAVTTRRILYNVGGRVYKQDSDAEEGKGGTSLPGNLTFYCEEQLNGHATHNFLKWTPHMVGSGADSMSQATVDLNDVTSMKAEGPRLVVCTAREGRLPAFKFARGATEVHNLLGAFRKHNLIAPENDSNSLFAPMSALNNLRSKVISVFSHVPQNRVRNRVTYRPDDDDEEEYDSVTPTDGQDPNLVVRELESGALGDFDVLDQESSLPERPEVTRTEPVSLKTLHEHLPDHKTVKNEHALRSAVFHGGLADDARAEAWKFFLNYRCPEGVTPEEFRAENVRKYNVMKQQWKSVLPEQVKRNSAIRDMFLSVRKDVPRTDRSVDMFAETDGEGLVMLHDILMTYCMYNFDLGYVQGMSDLVSVFLYVVQDEVDAFWLFANWMDELEGVFSLHQPGMLTKLSALGVLIRFVEPNLMAHLEQQESEHLMFCFSWLLVSFKREFALPDLLRMWDVLFSKHLSCDFSIFVCAAMIDALREPIMEGKLKGDEILGLSTNRTIRKSLPEVLKTAEGIFMQVKGAERPPEKLQPYLQTFLERKSTRADATATESAAQ